MFNDIIVIPRFVSDNERKMVRKLIIDKDIRILREENLDNGDLQLWVEVSHLTEEQYNLWLIKHIELNVTDVVRGKETTIPTFSANLDILRNESYREFEQLVRQVYPRL